MASPRLEPTLIYWMKKVEVDSQIQRISGGFSTGCMDLITGCDLLIAFQGFDSWWSRR
ncbi:hypothetical protein SLEP1_g2443 [Rubroshorea leprosula]|uniref:Uncharacterized protein n=1 Tax=Rubroshorea leprosula TaxID=152421 RepID=A0AAV5HQZ0_9ROSI|nr:hypothetical protein SLEP1_g2443 [Rubroshorea leprosula]